jgi:hypothetical protein
MPYLTMARDRVVSTLSGHVIRFTKDDPTLVPPAAVAECMQKGAIPFDGEEIPDSDDENHIPQAPGSSLDPASRKQAIVDAINKLVARDQRGDFDASGKPAAKMVSQLAGFHVDAKERNAVWAEMQGEQE